MRLPATSSCRDSKARFLMANSHTALSTRYLPSNYAGKDCKSAASSASIRRIKCIPWMRVGVAKAYVRGQIAAVLLLLLLRYSVESFLFLADFLIWFFIMRTQWQLSRGHGKLAAETVAGCRLHFAWGEPLGGSGIDLCAGNSS